MMRSVTSGQRGAPARRKKARKTARKSARRSAPKRIASRKRRL
jgi:hypothetical protein